MKTMVAEPSGELAARKTERENRHDSPLQQRRQPDAGFSELHYRHPSV